MSDPLSYQQLEQQIPYILASPKDNGELKLIVTRPVSGQRKLHDSIKLSVENGVLGDKWKDDCWMTLEDGSSDPDVQVCLINSRCIDTIATQKDRWPLAGDNLYVEIDLSRENIQIGDQLSLGSAVLEVTAVPHTACQKFASRYGRDASRFVNDKRGRSLRLRGVHAKIIKDGSAVIGDKISKLTPESA